MKKHILKQSPAFSLIEILVSITLITALTLSIYNLSIYSIRITAENKYRLAATAIADRKIEQIRNLPYDDVGTTAGIVHGVIPDNETVSDNNGNFYVNTFVQYIDDPFDGTMGGTPDDSLPNDYKAVRVRVSWNGPFGTKYVEAFTNVAPHGLETSVGGGTLAVLVFNANGDPVDKASVHIENNLLSPAITFDAETNTNGQLILPGAQPSVEGYEITVTKTGYSNSSTSPRTAANPNPTKPHATVAEGAKTEISFAIDLLSNLTIKTVQQNLPQNWQATDDTTNSDQTNPRIAIDDNGYIYLVWQDYRLSNPPKIFGQKYDPNTHAAQWPNPTTPADQNVSSASNQVLPDAVTDANGNLYTAWNDSSGGNEDSYFYGLDTNDGSRLWTGPRKIQTSANSKDQAQPRLSVVNNSSYSTTTVVWQDNRNGDWDIYLQQYDENRDEILTQEVKINSNSIGDGTNQYEPVVANDSHNEIYVAWTSDQNGNKDIYLAKISSTTASAEWEIAVTSLSADQYSPTITVDSLDNIYVAWSDERNSNQDIYMQKYDTQGNSLWASDVIINAHSDDNQYSPVIDTDSNNKIYIAWTDDRNGDQDIYGQKFSSDGTRLWTNDVRINVDLSGNQYNPDMEVSPLDDKPYVVWQSDEAGNADLFVSTFDTYGAENPIANVPVVITGAKRIGENPIIYKYHKTFTTNSNGTITLNNIEWDSYTIELDSSYTAYSLVMTIPASPIFLEPNTSQTITLYLE